MSKLDARASRRQFIRAASAGAVAVSMAGLLRVPTSAAAEMPKLSLDDPSAKALAYVHDTPNPAQKCNNCNFWQGGDAAWGGCPLFPGKAVAAEGWCKSWVVKS